MGSDKEKDTVVTLPILGVVGTKGTTFLHGAPYLAHLQAGETVSGMDEVKIQDTPEFATAIRELQHQHTDLLDFAYAWERGDHDDDLQARFDDIADLIEQGAHRV